MRKYFICAGMDINKTNVFEATTPNLTTSRTIGQLARLQKYLEKHDSPTRGAIAISRTKSSCPVKRFSWRARGYQCGPRSSRSSARARSARRRRGTGGSSSWTADPLRTKGSASPSCWRRHRGLARACSCCTRRLAPPLLITNPPDPADKSLSPPRPARPYARNSLRRRHRRAPRRRLRTMGQIQKITRGFQKIRPIIPRIKKKSTHRFRKNHPRIRPPRRLRTMGQIQKCPMGTRDRFKKS